MEEKTTSKRTPAKKAATGETVASPPARRTPAARKTVATGTEKKVPAKPAGEMAAEAASLPPADPPAAAAATEAPAPRQPTPEERYRMIESAAYFIAEKDGFRDCSTHYWTLAEQEVAERLGETAS